ncbi:MAG: SIS domain-containing protein [Bacteroidales bacterium]|nr:SIS domain-containing protein [Bacteroidales bacterium]
MTFSKLFLKECIEVIDGLDDAIIEQMAETLADTRKRNGRLFLIGSGGGAGHASHAVCDFRKLCNIEAYAPYDNVSELTARVNDEGWEVTIINWLKVSRFRSDDCVFVFSVGGGNHEKNISMNIVKVIEYANEIGAKIVGVVGKDGGYTKKLGDAVALIPIINPDHITPLTEGFQAVIWHLLVSHPKLQVNPTKWESAR